MKFLELNYESFEHIFVDCCNGCVVTGLDRPKIAKTDAQYVDWHILLPAIMDEDERLKYLGADYRKITKDTLNALRQGRVRRDYIDALFWKEDAVNIVFEHFLKTVPQAIVGADRRRVVEELWFVIQTDVIIPEKRRSYFEDKKNAAIAEIDANNDLPCGDQEQYDALCSFLAEAFVFSMKREKLLRDELRLSPIVVEAIKEFKKDKMALFNALLDSMSEAVILKWPDNELRDNTYLKSRNDTDYTDDDYRYLVSNIKGVELYEDQGFKYFAIAAFIFGIDERRLEAEAGTRATDALRERYIAQTECAYFNSREARDDVEYMRYSFSVPEGQKMITIIDNTGDAPVIEHIGPETSYTFVTICDE